MEEGDGEEGREWCFVKEKEWVMSVGVVSGEGLLIATIERLYHVCNGGGDVGVGGR